MQITNPLTAHPLFESPYIQGIIISAYMGSGILCAFNDNIAGWSNTGNHLILDITDF